MYRFIAIFSISLLLFTSCRDDRPEYGFVRLVIQHQWNGQPFVANDATEFTNNAGNTLRFTTFQYIISELTIGGGVGHVRVENPEVHFIDRDTTILITYQIPVGEHIGVSFVFGLNDQKNQTSAFPNLGPPMAWPQGMGGGFHYMKLDGRLPGTTQTFRLHLGALEELFQVNERVVDWGVGPPPNYDLFPIRTQIDSVFARYHNFLRVTVPIVLNVEPNTITTDTIIMDVEQWLENPWTWDFNVMNFPCTMPRRDALDSLAVNASTLGNTRGLFRNATITRGRDINNPVFRTVTVFR